MKKIFLSLTRKEQQLVVAAGVVFLLVILTVLNSALQDWKKESLLKFNSNHKLLSDVQKSLTLKSQFPKVEKINPNSLSSTVSSVARRFNLTIDRIQPTEVGEIMVSINQTEFVGLYDWLRELEMNKGITVSKASIRANSSRGTVSGVRAQLVLKIL
ncbi:MAG: type II secretion system protein M [SAR86 cluster bacterium]|nr:type II secretion system protein M [SAR86 cluster bacterium]